MMCPSESREERKNNPPEQINVTQGNTQSKTKLKRMLEKEIPHASIPEKDRPLYQAAEDKEWQSWLDYDSCEILSLEESE